MWNRLGMAIISGSYHTWIDEYLLETKNSYFMQYLLSNHDAWITVASYKFFQKLNMAANWYMAAYSRNLILIKLPNKLCLMLIVLKCVLNKTVKMLLRFHSYHFARWYRKHCKSNIASENAEYYKKKMLVVNLYYKELQEKNACSKVNYNKKI